ncbi:hypothetical protein WOLCODRAFT_162496 [Wolfiporia cocos MD-104 SS10]|uniref:C2H2-type domain-containing protein n=1 Tax=Wolfiporia cocos (strain MD-104) TaxID=742152 RepID=A0A2H3JEV9_WOLCO|nr:hypothetical protein WOLCODRAFT_162496 [Wolfiporia cocos MD-104 SS10]
MESATFFDEFMQFPSCPEQSYDDLDFLVSGISADHAPFTWDSTFDFDKSTLELPTPCDPSFAWFTDKAGDIYELDLGQDSLFADIDISDYAHLDVTTEKEGKHCDTQSPAIDIAPIDSAPLKSLCSLEAGQPVDITCSTASPPRCANYAQASASTSKGQGYVYPVEVLPSTSYASPAAPIPPIQNPAHEQSVAYASGTYGAGYAPSTISPTLMHRGATLHPSPSYSHCTPSTEYSTAMSSPPSLTYSDSSDDSFAESDNSDEDADPWLLAPRKRSGRYQPYTPCSCVHSSKTKRARSYSAPSSAHHSAPSVSHSFPSVSYQPSSSRIDARRFEPVLSTGPAVAANPRNAQVHITPAQAQWAVENLACPVPGCAYEQANQRPADMRRHLRSHGYMDSEREWVCCGVPVAQAAKLGMAAEEIAARKTVYQGVEVVGGCMRTFSRRDSLRRHFKNRRSGCCGDLRFICSLVAKRSDDNAY